MNRWIALAVLACACSGALAQEEPSVSIGSGGPVAAVAAAAPAEDTVGRPQTGIASWYGGRFHGRKTASGEAFDMHALTAAHPWLPFGSWVRVRNLVNGRSVDVRINDRGPHIQRRIIDLSRAAAHALGVSGTHQVELSLLDQRR